MKINTIAGTIVDAWVVLDGEEILATFPHERQAKGFAEDQNYTVKKYAAFLYGDGHRVSLFDPKAVYFVYEFGVDFEPEEMRKERETRRQALAKLSPEEKRSLGLL